LTSHQLPKCFDDQAFHPNPKEIDTKEQLIKKNERSKIVLLKDFIFKNTVAESTEPQR